MFSIAGILLIVLAIGLWAFAAAGLILPYIVGPVLRHRMRAANPEAATSD